MLHLQCSLLYQSIVTWFHILLKYEELPLIFRVVQICQQRTSSTYLPDKVFVSLSFLKDSFASNRILHWRVLTFITFEDVILLPLGLQFLRRCLSSLFVPLYVVFTFLASFKFSPYVWSAAI